MKKVYAGVGSRETPPEVLQEMSRLAECLAIAGWVLRSGAAPGADSAFEAGVHAASNDMLEIYLPWKGFAGHKSALYGTTTESLVMAETFHPAWGRLSDAAKKLHARNCHQILGLNLDDPVKFVVCWTPDGCESKRTRSRESGGTASAIVIGEKHGSLVFNLKNPGSRVRLTEYLRAESGIDVSWLGGKLDTKQENLF